MATPTPVAPPPMTSMSQTPECAWKRRYMSARFICVGVPAILWAPSTRIPLFSGHLQQPPLVDHLDSKSARLVQLRPGILARHHVGGLAADRAAHFASRRFNRARRCLTGEIRQRSGQHEDHSLERPAFLAPDLILEVEPGFAEA